MKKLKDIFQQQHSQQAQQTAGNLLTNNAVAAGLVAQEAAVAALQQQQQVAVQQQTVRVAADQQTADLPTADLQAADLQTVPTIDNSAFMDSLKPILGHVSGFKTTHNIDYDHLYQAQESQAGSLEELLLLYRLRIVFDRETTYLRIPFAHFERILDDEKLIIRSMADGKF